MEAAFVLGGRRERTDQDGLDSASKVVMRVACVEYDFRKNIPGDSRERNRTGGSNVILLSGGFGIHLCL